MHQLDPKSVWLFFLKSIIPVFVSVGIWGYLGLTVLPMLINGADGNLSFAWLNWVWLIIPILLIVCFIWAKLTYRFYRYELLDTGFRKESGVLSKKYATIPYDRIQNVDINRTIFARILGLSDLNIQTAGSSVPGVISEGRLPAVSKEVAERLRDELLQRARQSKNQGL
ncbi:MAG: PH domain-containing protein [bacterium]|nr:PH domain-containing protein [bacterium]